MTDKYWKSIKMNKKTIGRGLLIVGLIVSLWMGGWYFKQFVTTPILWIFVIPLTLYFPICFGYVLMLSLDKEVT